MRRALCSALLLPLIALAGGKSDLLKVRTVWNDGQYAGNTVPVYAAPRVTPSGLSRTIWNVGRIDTVGGTTYDWQVNGPCDEYVDCDSAFGVHVTWMYSAQTSGYTDRNMRYNFYDFAAESWNFIDPTNFMNSGVNAFSQRSGFGSLDVDPVTGCDYICCHQSGGPTVARDEAPGAGLFTECPGAPNVTAAGLPSMSLTSSEKVHVAWPDDSIDSIEYSRIDPWCTWSTPVALASGAPACITKGSKTSEKVVVTWVQENSSGPDTAWYRQSTDDGATWAPAVQIPLPPAFTPGSDSIATFWLAGIYPLYDDNDNLHVVATVGWTVASMAGMYVTPTEIWHWYQPNGTWSEVARWGEDTASYINNGYGVGYNALFAGRPTLCQSGPNEFVCVWEGFDWLNFEPATGLLRSEIFATRSIDNGATWGWSCQLTDPDSTSKRFPSIAPRAWRDTCFVCYEDDLVAGFGISPYGQGPVTNNPIIVQRFKPIWYSVSDDATRRPAVMALALRPNPVRGSSTISYDLPKSGNVRLSVCDVSGRTIRMLANESKGPGRYSARWDGKNDSGTLLPAGIYFCRLELGAERLTRKLVLLP